MVEADIPKRVVVVLLILTIVVSFLGTLTFLEVYNSLSGAKGGAAQGTVSLTILEPNTPAPVGQEQSTDSAGKVSITIKKQEG